MRLDGANRKLANSRNRLGGQQGRVTRHNARRNFLGVLRSVLLALDAEFPAIAKPAVSIDPIDAASRKLHWREFEHGVIKHVRRQWDYKLAQAFNEWISERDWHPAKPIVFDFRTGTRCLLGQHMSDRIRLNRDLSDSELWRVLPHENAHYHVHHHRRAFVVELARVYKLWREFLQMRRAAAARS